MPRLSQYVLGQLIGPTALFAFLVTAIIWLSQSLRLLDLVINRGQSAPTFVYLTILTLPGLFLFTIPFAFFAGALFGLNKLSSDSELVVMTAAGYGVWQLARPVLALAGIVMAFTYLNSLWLMPFSERIKKDKVMSISADIGAAILTEGTFNTPVQGLTVFIRELAPDGHISGILVHDNRNAAHPVTYISQSGVLAQTPMGARLIMDDGTIERSDKAGAKLSVLKFQRYVFDLDQFANKHGETIRELHELYLPELFWPHIPPHAPERTKQINILFAEGQSRLAEPLYALAFALIALAAVTQGRRARGAYAIRLIAASVIVGGLRIAGYGVQGLAARDPMLVILLYLVPLAAGAIAALVLTGWRPFAKPIPLAEPEFAA